MAKRRTRALVASRQGPPVTVTGHATPLGTARFAARHRDAHPRHFRAGARWTASSIGIGTFPGSPDSSTDERYEHALRRAVERGVNLVDTAVAYREQRSERAVGRAVAALVAEGRVQRDELVLVSKAGFLPFDADYPGSVDAYYAERFVKTGAVTPEDLVPPGHCIAPRFLVDQIDQSRGNLGCDTIDVFLLHNPDAQLRTITRTEFLRRIRDAFAALEAAVDDGKIGSYGVSSWGGFRAGPDEPTHLSLQELLSCAREVAGEGHRFAVLLTVLNVRMRDALERGAMAQAADEGVDVLVGSPLHGGRLTGGFRSRLRRALGTALAGDAVRAVQFARSAPGVTTALVGTTDPAHVDALLDLAAVAPLDAQGFEAALGALAGPVRPAGARVERPPVDGTPIASDATEQLLREGRRLARLARYEDAADHLRRAAESATRVTRRDPGDVAVRRLGAYALLSLGRLQAELSRTDDATSTFRSSLAEYRRAEAEPGRVGGADDALAAMSIARLEAGLGRPDTAEWEYRRARALAETALATTPQDPAAREILVATLASMGRLFALSGRSEDAAAAFDEAIADAAAGPVHLKTCELDDQVGAAFISRGRLEQGTGRRDLAEASYRAAATVFARSLSERGEDALVHHNIGNTHTRLAELFVEGERYVEAMASLEAAIDSFEAALDVAPRSVVALNSLGSSLMALGREYSGDRRWEDARACYQAALDAFSLSLDLAPARVEIRQLRDQLVSIMAETDG